MRMAGDHFPTFRRAADAVARTVCEPDWRRWSRIAVLPSAGLLFAWVWPGLADSFVPVHAWVEPWHLYPYALGGFGGALLAAWGLRHGWVGLLYGAALGFLFGGWLFVSHGVLGMTADPDRGYCCVLLGDRAAGILFFSLALIGAFVGIHLAEGRVPLLSGAVTAARILLWVIALCVVAGSWVALYYLTPALMGY